MRRRFHGLPILWLGLAGLGTLWCLWEDSRTHRSELIVQKVATHSGLELVHWNRQVSVHLIRCVPGYRAFVDRRGSVGFEDLSAIRHCGTVSGLPGPAKAIGFERRRDYDLQVLGQGVGAELEVERVPGAAPSPWSVSVHVPYWLLTILYLIVWPMPWLFLRWRAYREKRKIVAMGGVLAGTV
jgi:hypothetical protein